MSTPTLNIPPRPNSDDELHDWLRTYLDLDVPRTPVCEKHQPPFDYVRAAFAEPATDLVVWAPRGGGKTRLAAAVTVLDLLYKPGISIRILGGSLEQSLRMWEHLVPDLVRVLGEQFDEKWNRRRTIRLPNGSSVAVLAQSQRAVRGLRIQKLRCDEVENFRPDVWEAAQLVTRSLPGAGASVEAISTLNTPWGLMMKIVDRARARAGAGGSSSSAVGGGGATLFQWCLLDVLETCPPQRPCETCALWDACQGVAKTKCRGFVRIDDAIAMKRRVSRETWDNEMLCLRPTTRGAVFRHFDPALHVRDPVPTQGALYLGVDFGFAAPFVCLWILEAPDGSRHVIDEYVQDGRVTHEHVEQIRLRPWGEPRALCCDPAGKATSDQTARSNVDALRAAGFLVKTRHSGIIEGIELVRAALCPAEGPTTLFVHPRCVRLIKAMQCYRYGENSGELPLKDGEHDHLVDALRYYFVNRQVGKTSWGKY